jgi:nucleotide-binding universal stress UspA family protein
LTDRSLDAVTPEELEAGPEPGYWRKEYLEARRKTNDFTSILVPVSGAEKGWCALDQAILFGQKWGARLYGFHVVQTEDQKQGESALAVKTEFEQRCQAAGVPGELAIDVGKPAQKICERAFWTDLVIINLSYPPGPQPLEKLRSGFRAIIHRCPRPILAVPKAATTLERALLAYDGSPKADEALFVGAYFADCWNTELLVVTVTDIGGITTETLSLAKNYLDKHHVKATFIEEQGAVGEAILRAAHEQACNCIIMGGYGRNPMLEIVFGSSVDYVLRESQIPILICR